MSQMGRGTLKKIDRSYDGLDMNNKDFNKDLNFALHSIGSSSDYENGRDRPYNGQPHTDQGERGKTMVQGLTMRDVMDCFVMGYLEATKDMAQKVKEGNWRYNDIFKSKDEGVDPLAAGQNMMCHVEKMMGIFPNLPSSVPSVEDLIDHWGEGI